MMRWWLVLLLIASAAAKGKKHRHHKPGRALLDRLSSAPVPRPSPGLSGAPRGASGAGGAGEQLPAPLDVAPLSAVTASATCGQDGAEEFCRETPAKHLVVCDVCEGPEGSPARQHPPSHAVDGDPATWWQSPSMPAGDYQVDFVATLPDKMELLYVIVKSGPSPRPLAWSLEVSPSEAGEDWRMVRAFGDKDHCKRLWDLRPERRRRKARSLWSHRRARAAKKRGADKPTCSTQFASPKPLENGEMHVGTGPGVLARRVRLSLRAAHAATPGDGDGHSSGAAPARFTVRALALAARCLCHGHASHCHVTTEGSRCSCVHGTCGSHCQRCCSGAAWASGRECERDAGSGAGGSDGDGECACAERGACAVDDSGAILCVNCTDNRAGPLCDKCLTDFYAPDGDGPCLPCPCHPDGSDGSCTWDRHQGLVCACLAGFTGPKCDECSDTRRSFPACETETAISTSTPAPRCHCDPRGVADPDGVCDDVCVCKVNVVGERCDACAPGHFGLGAGGGGCVPCYCSHVTDDCVLRETGDHDEEMMSLPLSSGWLVTDAHGRETLEPSVDDQGNLYLISYEVEGWESYYWISAALSGEQLSLYGKDLVASTFWGIVRGDTGGSPTSAPDVILVAADGTKLACTNRSYSTPGVTELTVPLVEGQWWELGREPARESLEPLLEPLPASRAQLMDVLADLRAVMLRAHFHGDQDEVRLERVSFRPLATALREQCRCPWGYAGAHCTRCAPTHARAPSGLCLSCACNGHASCDTVDGPCGPCRDNTTGPHCERCLPGHYGNPVQGACKPCACPLLAPANNFSPNCALAAATGDDFVCTQCPDGYSGDHCEHCDFGYFGSPMTPGETCRPCACAGAPCHPTSGECLSCPPHREGARCDQCQEGFWFGPDGDASSEHACVACGCGAGALSAACDVSSGRCACGEGWEGDKCDSCKEGYGGVSSGCPRCRCGTAASGACDAATGDCACAPGAAPPNCEACLPMHYALTEEGCKGCNCSELGAEGNACDIRTGQCRCKPHVTGRACDTCEEGFWGLSAGGCRRCACGPGASACDARDGRCACAPGVAGERCDHCLPGYFGFGPLGCEACPPCSDGKVCSPTSGVCVCPLGSRGPQCRLCAAGFHWRAGGCQRCRCGPGALNNTCDSAGSCACRTGWAGPRCDACAVGHFGPRCRPCGCSAAGALCGDDGCPCDDDGRCRCKENVVGDKCDSCLSGTFGLSASNPLGCTACFCFGRAAACAQAQAARAAIHAATPTHVTLLRSDVVTTMDQNSLLSIHTRSPDVTISLPWPPTPVYIELDKRFTGDRVLSYGGALRFRVEEEGGLELDEDTRARFPLVRMYAGDIVLDYHERVPAINGTHVVRLHESLWRVRGGGRGGDGTATSRGLATSRGALMLALQGLQRLLVRATTRAPTYDEHVHALLLNVSLDTAIPGLSRSEPALGVELCECRRGFAATSCQQPAVGFWMPRQSVRVTEVAGTIVISLEGEPQPCKCNGRAVACDPRTGDCLNCTNGTGGPRCEVCAAGFHGAPNAPGGCQACPCPTRARNFARACALSGERLHCLCKPGYEGLECELCAAGYVRAADGSCGPCGCDPRGSLLAHCDARGRCLCQPFVTGDKCDQCLARRTYLDEDGCNACDNCTTTLLDAIEDMTLDLHNKIDLDELSRIPKPFGALREFAANTSALSRSVQEARRNLENSRNVEPLIHELETREHRVFTAAHELKTEAERRKQEANRISEESMNGLEEVLEAKRLVGERVAQLDEFARGEGHVSAHRALKQGRHLLKLIKGVRLTDDEARVDHVMDLATAQSRRVQQYEQRTGNAQRRLTRLQTQLERGGAKVDDVPRLAETAWGGADRVASVASDVRPRLARLRDLGLRCRLVLEDIINLSPQNVTSEIQSTILRAATLVRSLPAIIAELDVLTLATEEKEGILYNLTPAYRDKYLTAVEQHVKMLGQKAKEYKSLFAGARAASSKGVAAAHSWGEVAATVREAGELATSAQNTAAQASARARGPTPMSNAADASVRASEDLKRRGAAVLAKAEELRSQLEHLRQSADLVSVMLRGLGWQERELGLRPTADVTGVLAGANEQADRVFATTRAVYDEASELRRRARYGLRRQLAELSRQGDTALGAAQEHVSQIRSNTWRARQTADALAAAARAREGERQAAEGGAGERLRALRDRVARARHAADSISVSLTSAAGGGCARAYPLQTTSPAVTKVAVAVSFDATVADGTLLYLLDDTQETPKYMKLTVERQRLLLRWDLGAGEGVIEHPELLQATHDDGDHTSYRIEVERVWNTAHLTLERVGGSSTTAENSTAPAAGAVSLHTTQLWLGAPEVGESRMAALPGCVHALYSEDRLVGLWNFARQPEAARCTGCTQRWYNGGRASDSGMAWFNGAGYAELHRSALRPADARHFSLSFTFRTRDPHALLFLAVDASNNRSVSVVLRECRVVFAVQYADSQLEIGAGGRHCGGRPAHVQAIRVFAGNKLERGSLRVNGEETLGSPSPPVVSASSLPDLSRAAYWAGGVPPGDTPLAPAPPLLGCLGALAVNREGYDLLSTPTRHGVEARCGERTLRSATLEGQGFIELASPLLRRRSAVGLSFRARAPRGLLLLRAPSAGIGGNDVDDDDADDTHYLALALVDGELELLASAGKDDLRLRANGTRFDDGLLHTVRIVRVHKQLELWADERLLLRGALLGQAMRARSHGLFVGGVAAAQQLIGRAADVPRAGFVGTVADLIVDSTLVGLESAIDWSNARLGRADAAPWDATRKEPRELHEQPSGDHGCTKTSSFTVEAGAVKFGDAPWSHAAVRLRPPSGGGSSSGSNKELVLTMHFRTFAGDGLLLLVPGTKAKPRHYVALVVRGRRLRLQLRGRRRKELDLADDVSDGAWRSVSLRISASRASLSMGGRSASAHVQLPAAARAPRLFVGGRPAPPALPQLPKSLLRLGGFVGCVRRVTVNGRSEDLVRDARSHHHVGQCFPQVEPGAYFGGDAYATWTGAGAAWTEAGETAGAAGSGAAVAVRFRALAAGGVLVALHDFVLELSDGALVLSRVSPTGGVVSRTETLGAGGRGLCDGQWHFAEARLGGGGGLRLDAGMWLRAAAAGTLVDAGTTPDARAALYVGGLPEGALEGSEGRENFKGCIRDVEALGRKLQWAALERRNVLLDSCPNA